MGEIEQTERKMDFDLESGNDRVAFDIPENVYKRFQKTANSEGQSVAKLISQFLVCYTLFLDRSFQEHKKKRPGPSRTIALRTPKEICARYKEKCKREGVGLKHPINRFVRNYLDFMESGVGKSAPGRKKAE